MAAHLAETDTTTTTDEPGGGRDAFLERMSDVKSAKREASTDDADEVEDDDSGTLDDTEEDTSDDDRERHAESNEDDEADDSEDTVEEEDDSNDDESEEETEDADDEQDDDAPDDTDDDVEEEAASDETTAALKRHGADLSLDDVPAKYRPIVEKKIKQLDRVFTHAMMEARAYRTEEKQFRADAAFREKNSDLVIVEMLQKDPALLERVNKHIERMSPGEDGANAESAKDAKELFDERVKNARKSANDTIEAQEQESQALFTRADEVLAEGREIARKYKVPFGGTIERLLAAAITAKPEKERKLGLTTAEVNAVVKDYADEHHRSTSAVRREASKSVVKERTAKKLQPKPTVRTKGGTSSHNARRPERVKVNYDDAESRRAGMLRTANRVTSRER